MLQQRSGLRDTENPKVSGWSANRRLRIVDFPDPEGPEMTIGRCFSVNVHQSMSKWRVMLGKIQLTDCGRWHGRQGEAPLDWGCLLSSYW